MYPESKTDLISEKRVYIKQHNCFNAKIFKNRSLSMYNFTDTYFTAAALACDHNNRRAENCTAQECPLCRSGEVRETPPYEFCCPGTDRYSYEFACNFYFAVFMPELCNIIYLWFACWAIKDYFKNI